ncbi:MAG TPA: hypothetical protein PLF81_24955 [Candidatus Anammoximicrobium sp.]|nr:hypothetical protein [Candidatus Anammoximicrobium sp.]
MMTTFQPLPLQSAAGACAAAGLRPRGRACVPLGIAQFHGVEVHVRGRLLDAVADGADAGRGFEDRLAVVHIGGGEHHVDHVVRRGEEGLPTSPKPPTAGLADSFGRPAVGAVLPSGDRSPTGVPESVALGQVQIVAIRTDAGGSNRHEYSQMPPHPCRLGSIGP